MLVTVKGAGSWCKKAWLPTCKLPDSRQLSIGGGEKELESRLCQDLTTTAQVSHLRTHLLISNNTVLPDLWGGGRAVTPTEVALRPTHISPSSLTHLVVYRCEQVAWVADEVQESIFYKASCSGISNEHPVWKSLNSPSSGRTHLDAPSLPRKKDNTSYGSRDGTLG